SPHDLLDEVPSILGRDARCRCIHSPTSQRANNCPKLLPLRQAPSPQLYGKGELELKFSHSQARITICRPIYTRSRMLPAWYPTGLRGDPGFRFRQDLSQCPPIVLGRVSREPPSPALAQIGTQTFIGPQLVDAIRDGFAGAWVDEHGRNLNLLANPSNGGGQHWTAIGPGLEHRNVRRPEERRHDERGRFCIQRRHILVCNVAEILKVVLQAETRREVHHVTKDLFADVTRMPAGEHHRDRELILLLQ